MSRQSNNNNHTKNYNINDVDSKQAKKGKKENVWIDFNTSYLFNKLMIFDICIIWILILHWNLRVIGKECWRSRTWKSCVCILFWDFEKLELNCNVAVGIFVSLGMPKYASDRNSGQFLISLHHFEQSEKNFKFFILFIRHSPLFL